MSEANTSAREPSHHVVLIHPVIPQNTGSVARLCACTGAKLHLIHPLGFSTDAKAVKRAGLDYWPHVNIQEHVSWDAFVAAEKPKKLVLLSKFAKKSFYKADLSSPVYLVLGSETTGLPDTVWEKYKEARYQIPMRTDLVRSLNLAQAAAVVLYEALRQEAFPNLDHPPPFRPSASSQEFGII